MSSVFSHHEKLGIGMRLKQPVRRLDDVLVIRPGKSLVRRYYKTRKDSVVMLK